MSQEHIDISVELRAICQKLGLTYDDVAGIHIRPGSVTAQTFDRNENGAFHLDAEDNVACTNHVFKI